MISITTQPADLVFSKGDVFVKLFAGESAGVPWTPDTKPVNYAVEFEVLMERVYESGTFDRIFMTYEYPNALGDINTNIQSILHSGIFNSYTDPPLPPIGDTSNWVTDNLRKYKVRAREIQGTDFTEGSWLDIGTDLKAIYGGVTVDKSIDAWDPSALTAAQKIFSWMPSGMLVGLDQPYYVTLMDGGSITAELYDIDNALLDSETIPVLSVPGECRTYFVGPALFSAGDLEDGYKVKLLFPGSLERTYYLDHYRTGKMDLVFINGFGAPECIRMYGELDESMKVTRLKSQAIRRPDTELAIGDMVQYAGSWEDDFLLRTGYISEGEARAMKDMLAYNFLYWIRGTVYESLDIVTDDIPISSTGQFLKALEFNAQRSVKKKIMPTL